ncbi:MAG: hypothetical protein E6593_17115 [Clostridium sp.]|nr:hypothetical protein [Clostridium sp.]
MLAGENRPEFSYIEQNGFLMGGPLLRPPAKENPAKRDRPFPNCAKWLIIKEIVWNAGLLPRL